MRKLDLYAILDKRIEWDIFSEVVDYTLFQRYTSKNKYIGKANVKKLYEKTKNIDQLVEELSDPVDYELFEWYSKFELRIDYLEKYVDTNGLEGSVTKTMYNAQKEYLREQISLIHKELEGIIQRDREMGLDR